MNAQMPDIGAKKEEEFSKDRRALMTASPRQTALGVGSTMLTGRSNTAETRSNTAHPSGSTRPTIASDPESTESEPGPGSEPIMNSAEPTGLTYDLTRSAKPLVQIVGIGVNLLYVCDFSPKILDSSSLSDSRWRSSLSSVTVTSRRAQKRRRR